MFCFIGFFLGGVWRFNMGRFVLSVCDRLNMLINMVLFKKDVVSYDNAEMKYLVLLWCWVKVMACFDLARKYYYLFLNGRVWRWNLTDMAGSVVFLCGSAWFWLENSGRFLAGSVGIHWKRYGTDVEWFRLSSRQLECVESQGNRLTDGPEIRGVYRNFPVINRLDLD
jgi:hypothetical protein